MENLKETRQEVIDFLRVNKYLYGDGSGSGNGFSNGSGNGSGHSSGYGSDDGSGYGPRVGNGNEYGRGDGSGNGSGSCYNDKNGGGYGCGYSYGYGRDVISINNQIVYNIDDICTLIDSVHGNYAKGRILNSDLTTKPCFIAKCGDFFAHDETLKQAFKYAQEKYNENKPIEERIADFNAQYPDRNKKVPASELFYWHHILTGSCLFGRKQFCEERNIDYKNGMYSVNEFIKLTKNAYNGNVIKMLIE